MRSKGFFLAMESFEWYHKGKSKLGGRVDMRRKWLPLFLAVCMLISVLPMTALAAEEAVVTVTVAGTQVYDEAQDVVTLVNQERTAAGESAVTHNATLNALAMQRAAELALYFSHTRPDGSDYFTVLNGEYSGGTACGENIAIGQDSAAEVMEYWMNSQGHKENILNSKFTQIGVGCFYCNGVMCWVQLFGNSTSNTAETTNTGYINTQVSVDTLTSNLDLRLYKETDEALDVGDSMLALLVSVNREFDYMETVLVPQVSNIKSSDGTTIAAVKADLNGQLTVTAKNEGTGSVALPVYAGQEDPVTLTVTVGAHAHSYTAVVTKPTCTEDGYTTYTCACGDSYTGDTVAATGHSWDDGEVTQEPTEESTGIMTYTCTVCSATQTETIPELGHEHSYTAVVTEPTCTEDGYTTYTCSCGDTYTADEVEALGHTWDDGVVTEEATEDTDGVRTYTCTVCGETKTEVIPSLNHEHSYTTVVTAPTCTEAGYTTYTCACGDTYTGDEVAALGHSWGEWETTTEPTATEEGLQERSCTVCGETETQTLAALGNPFTDVSEEDYYYDAVLWAVENEITTGTTTTTFSPDEDCTRAQIVTFLWRTAGKPEPASDEHPFTDLDSSQYYYDAVLWAVEQGITTGTSDTTFSPNDTCTRAQVATFLWRAAGKPNPENPTDPFTDLDEEQYYYTAVLWAVEQGITDGVGGGKFAPDATCTRGQIVTFLHRAAE